MITHPNNFVLPIIAVPIVLAAMAHFRLISSDMLVRLRRYAIFGFFAIAAVFTPPDALSELVAALALIGLYEISIWCVRAAG
jgi:sec-independent protein translocase protein TatC